MVASLHSSLWTTWPSTSQVWQPSILSAISSSKPSVDTRLPSPVSGFFRFCQTLQFSFYSPSCQSSSASSLAWVLIHAEDRTTKVLNKRLQRKRKVRATCCEWMLTKDQSMKPVCRLKFWPHSFRSPTKNQWIKILMTREHPQFTPRTTMPVKSLWDRTMAMMKKFLSKMRVTINVKRISKLNDSLSIDR